MRWIRALILTFSTYTRIPMPAVKWDEDAMKLSAAFLPLVGALIGCAVWGWQIFCRSMGFGAALFAAVTAALPVFITGGIHLDGYCDTADALASWQDRERRLAILKDPHVGAFALIRFVTYILVSFALLQEIYESGRDAGMGLIFVLSRGFAAWSAMTLPNARKDGMLAAFAVKADRRAAFAVLAFLTAAGSAGFIFITRPFGFAGLALCLPVTLWYRSMAMKRFGGATGDTTGFYLQLTELALITGLLAGGLMSAWI